MTSDDRSLTEDRPAVPPPGRWGVVVGSFIPASLPMVVDIAPYGDTTEVLATLPVVGWGAVTEPEGNTTSVQPFVQLVDPFSGPDIDDAGLMPADSLHYRHAGGWRPTRVAALRHGSK